MPAALFLTGFLIAGAFQVRFLLPKLPCAVRLWIGMSAGLLEAMWFPALFAFAFRFGLVSHILAVLLAVLLTVLLGFIFKEEAETFRRDRFPARALLFAALPLFLLAVYLQATHVLCPAGGALHTGQSTYGDLPLHLGIITSFRNAVFPAEYSILPGTRLSYPFLTDSLSASMMLMGMDLRWAVIFPSAVQLFLCFSGFVLFADRVIGRKGVPALAALLLFVNGGLGFLYVFDMLGVSLGTVANHQLQMGTWLDRLRNILAGWYQTPVNHAEFSVYNLRWSNMIVDMLTPQRTFLAGFTLVLPCLYLLYDMVLQEKWTARQSALLGVMAGALPVVHTHSYLAIALVSLGLFLRDLARRKRLAHWFLYAFFAATLSVPQLFAFTFGQVGEGFIRFRFNWVNNLNGTGLQDEYFLFYIKNIGLPFVILVCSFFEKDKTYRSMFVGALTVWAAAELIQFQPNPYDNNKLLYVAYALLCVPIADYSLKLWDRMRGLRARPLIAILFCVLCFTGGSLSLAREAVSDYEMFSKNNVQAARFIEEQTGRDDLFLTGVQHLNPVSALAGRKIVCGPDLWLHWHGFNTSARQKDIAAMYEAPAEHQDLLHQYGVRYIYVSSWERGGYSVDEAGLKKLYPVVYQDGEASIYEVRHD